MYPIAIELFPPACGLYPIAIELLELEPNWPYVSVFGLYPIAIELFPVADGAYPIATTSVPVAVAPGPIDILLLGKSILLAPLIVIEPLTI